MKSLLELKKRISAKRPRFRHYDWQKRKEVGTRWRRPRGLHNKMRKGVWGRPATVNPGYRSPVAVRGMTRDGLLPVRVYNSADLSTLNAKTEGVLLGKVGARKRALLLEECKKKGLTVLNHKNVDESIKAVAGALNERKAAKKARAEARAKRDVGAQKKPAPKPKAEEPKSQEEQKKEQDKVLTQREA